MSLPGVVPAATPGVEWRLEVALGNLNDPTEFLYDDPAALYDTALYSGNEISWTEITPRGLSFNFSRGREKWGAAFRAGSGSLLLDSDDGVFNPNFGTVELGNVVLRPGRFVRISGRFEGDFDYVPLFMGRIESLADVYLNAASAINSAWEISDLASYVSIFDPPARQTPIPAGQITSERAVQLLREAGFPDTSLVQIEPGLFTMGESSLGSDFWSELQVAAAAEGGAFFFAANGQPVFKDQTFNDPKAIKFEAGFANSDVQVIDATTQFSIDNVRNDIQMARIGGTAQAVSNTVSQSLYGRRTHRQFDLECETDAQVFTLAERYRDYWAFDQIAVRSCQLIPVNEQGVRDLLALELGDAIQLQINTGQGWSYAAAVIVQKIQMAGTSDDWVVTLTVENMDRSNPTEGGPYSLAYDPAEYHVDES